VTRADITNLLNKWLTGDEAARNELFDLVYDNLRAMAKRYMMREKPGHTLRPTDLVNEAYIRVQAYNPKQWTNRAHFFAVFARAMRHVLVDHARHKLTAKQGGGLIRIPLDEIDEVPDKHYITLVKLDGLLDKLTEEDSIASSVFHLRHFTGLTAAEIAAVLEINVTKVNRSLRYAKAWLQRALKTNESGSTSDESLPEPVA
jgi:RNA polymerase sigma factor (TIGR02999 family)